MSPVASKLNVGDLRCIRPRHDEMGEFTNRVSVLHMYDYRDTICPVSIAR